MLTREGRPAHSGAQPFLLTLGGLLLLTACVSPQRAAETAGSLSTAYNNMVLSEGNAFARSMFVSAAVAYQEGGQVPFEDVPCNDPRFETFYTLRELTVQDCTVTARSDGEVEISVRFTNGLALQGDSENLRRVDGSAGKQP